MATLTHTTTTTTGPSPDMASVVESAVQQQRNGVMAATANAVLVQNSTTTKVDPTQQQVNNNKVSSQQGTNKHHSYHPHHRSSEVYAPGTNLIGNKKKFLLSQHRHQNQTTTEQKSTPGVHHGDGGLLTNDDHKNRVGDDNDDSFNISMVCPLTIEDAIKHMQRVPSVEFTCSLTKKKEKKSSSLPSSSLQLSSTSTSASTLFAANGENGNYRSSNDHHHPHHHRHYHNHHPYNDRMNQMVVANDGCDDDDDEDDDDEVDSEEKRDHFAPLAPIDQRLKKSSKNFTLSSSSSYTTRPLCLFSRSSSTTQHPSNISNQPTASDDRHNRRLSSSAADPATTTTSFHHQSQSSTSTSLAQSSSNNQPTQSKVPLSSSSPSPPPPPFPNKVAPPPLSPYRRSYSIHVDSLSVAGANVAAGITTTATVNSFISGATSSSIRSSSSATAAQKRNSTTLNPSGTTGTSGTGPSPGPGTTTTTMPARRQTVARLGSETADAERYFTPRESWLTSLYVRLPKSKSFFRLQLELLNLPLFASVGRFLEETATCADQKALLEDNSFLFALFNQFVPHNRIPLETLSKHLAQMQKYEILATIEFSFLKVPFLNRRVNSSIVSTTSSITGITGSGTTTTTRISSGSEGKVNNNKNASKNNNRTTKQQQCNNKKPRYILANLSTTTHHTATRHANKLENLAKNTNQRYVPYDYNRVVLKREQHAQDEKKQPKTDYINASHVDSLLKPNAYIVAQGPNENSLGDFWCMIWQQNIHVVVMLTKVYEFIRVMCNRYWPMELNKPEVFDEQYEVTLVDEDRLADYVVRTMKVRCLRPQLMPPSPPRHHYHHGGGGGSSSRRGRRRSKQKLAEDDIEYLGHDGGGGGDGGHHHQNEPSSAGAQDKNHGNDSGGECRTIYQLHFLSWNVNSCPYSDAILKFRRRVQIYEKQCLASSPAGKSGPLLVHCSNGCGRSGSYVCLDANLQLAEEEGVVDVFNYAKQLRKARVDMIENLEQYKFIYETIEESYVCGVTWFHVSEIGAQMKRKSVKDKESKRNEYQNEFDKLMRMTSKFSIGDCAGGHRLENRYKNRDVSIVPPDNFRPYLTTFHNDQTDYINAVFVDGYSRPREYIVTEWPLKRTIPDLWSLIYDHDCNTIVVLGGVPPNDKSFPMFWPKNPSSSSSSQKSQKYGSIFTVDTISTHHPPNINSWVLRVNKKVTSLTELMAGIKAEPKIAHLFEFEAWPYDYKVPKSTNALVELIHMVERWRQRTGYGPVLVISANGKARVGMYCAANFAIEQVVAHEEIDIFNAVKTVRRHRSALIETIMEYKYCYDLTLHYVSHYMNKGPENQIYKKGN